MSLPRDLVEMLSVFASDDVRYLVIGGHAVSLHARPRSTKDLDVWLDAEPNNIARACAALIRFGVPRAIAAQLEAAGAEDIVWIGRIPARVDFFKSAPGVKFARAWDRRVQSEIEGVVVHFIGREDLIANKRAVARPQDLRDVRALERTATTKPSKPRVRKSNKR